MAEHFDPVERPAHYVAGGHELTDYLLAHGLGWCEGNVVKYVTRWRKKGGLEDLQKARWYLERLIREVQLHGA
jgi:hypothetical protein